MKQRNLKDLVQPGKLVSFTKYRKGYLYYLTDCGFEFPVPVADLGDASCMNVEKASMYMRYIRKHLEHSPELT